MPNQVDGAFVRCAMSGTELSRVRTEFRLRPPEPINQSHSSRGADIVMQSSVFGPILLVRFARFIES